MDAWTAILAGAALASGLGAVVLSIAAVAHHLGATPPPSRPPPCWAERVDPDLLIPPPSEPLVLLVIERGRVVRERRITYQSQGRAVTVVKTAPERTHTPPKGAA